MRERDIQASGESDVSLPEYEVSTPPSTITCATWILTSTIRKIQKNKTIRLKIKYEIKEEIKEKDKTNLVDQTLAPRTILKQEKIKRLNERGADTEEEKDR